MTTDDEPGVLQDLRDILASDLTQWSTGHVCDTGVHYDEGVMRGSTDTLRRVISLIDALAAAPDSDATDVQRRAKACNEPGAVLTATPEEIINTALCCAEGEAAIEEYEERAARAWLTTLISERDAALRELADRTEDLKVMSEAGYAAQARCDAALRLAEERAGVIEKMRTALLNVQEWERNLKPSDGIEYGSYYPAFAVREALDAG